MFLRVFLGFAFRKVFFFWGGGGGGFPVSGKVFFWVVQKYPTPLINGLSNGRFPWTKWDFCSEVKKLHQTACINKM